MKNAKDDDISRSARLGGVGMQIFLSYASEDREHADQVHLALAAGGYQVFFDRDSLPPGGEYHTRIRNAVEHSDIFVFLISPNSVAAGSYALTELKYARTKWPHPKGRVLPVRLQEVAWEQIPSFLKAVTVLEPEGNIPAETLVAVSEMIEEVIEEGLSAQTMGASNSDAESVAEFEKTHKITVPVLIAVIGMVGVLGAAAIANWDKLFPPRSKVTAETTNAVSDAANTAIPASNVPLKGASILDSSLDSTDRRSLRMNLSPQDTSAHLGVASCASSVCHGNVSKQENTNVRQNEYVVWLRQGRHSSAYRTLLNDKSRQIASRLDIGEPENALECLGCHSDPVPSNLAGARHQLSDGVGCEVCHGGAADWIESHAKPRANHASNVAQGMRPLNDPLNAFSLCFSCHVDFRLPPDLRKLHESGHPVGGFDLQLFIANQPPHYDVDKDYTERKRNDPFFSVWMASIASSLQVYLPLIEEPGGFEVVYPQLKLLESATKVIDPTTYPAILERTRKFQTPTTALQRTKLASELTKIIAANSRAWLSTRTGTDTLNNIREELLNMAADSFILNYDFAANVFVALQELCIAIGDDDSWRVRLDLLYETVKTNDDFDPSHTRQVLTKIITDSY